MKFLQTVLATFVGLMIFFGVIILIFAGIASSTSSQQETDVQDKSVLKIELNLPIVERNQEVPFAALPIPGASAGSIGLISLKRAIQAAKNNDKIQGIYMDPGLTLAGFATLEEIREALLDFKESGKFIVAYSEIMSEKGYYLASVADYIFVHPLGQLEFNGFAVEVTFFKETLDKIGVDAQVFKVGDFKSAVEPFTRTSMSDSSRLQTREYLENLYKIYLEGIAATRGMTVEELRNLADSMKVQTPVQAKEYGLITDTAYYNTSVEQIGKELGLETDDKGNINVDDVKFISLKKYEKSLEQQPDDYSNNRIGVIVANGPIVSGKGEGTVIGSKTFAKEIRKARLDDNVKAIVLRINSGGGSSIASDAIWQEVNLAQQEKPVIASMSDVAASGGYAIAMACDTIVAHPNTITGSIGVFGVLPNVQEMLNKLGISTDVVQTGTFSNIYRVTKPLSEAEYEILQNSAERVYEDFTRKAAQGRNMSVEALRAVASGRVWSGLQAKERNLIDVLGGLNAAINIAIKKAEIEEDYQVRYYPRKKTFLEQLMSQFDMQLSSYLLKKELGIIYPQIKQLKEVEQLQGVQSRLPYEIKIY
jgi:protease IV